MLAALASFRSDEAAERAQAREMAEALRQLMANRRTEELRRDSPLALFATVMAAIALLACVALAYYLRRPATLATASNDIRMVDDVLSSAAGVAPSDSPTNLTIAELAKRAPSLRTGTVQAWWVGEQARQVQRLEALAKKQALAGDRDGAARTASRADAIRSTIGAIADVEKAPMR